jgi:hypothetical protein
MNESDIRREALEEAAKACEAEITGLSLSEDRACQDCAAAVRALIDQKHTPEQEARARLIEAAPALLNAAGLVLDAFGRGMASMPVGSPKREALRALRDARDAAEEKA